MTTVRPGIRTRRSGWALLGLTPFAVWVLLFSAVPTLIALGTGFVDGDGAFTLDNVAGLAEPAVIGAFVSSFWLSGLTAAVGAVVGALVCWALTAAKPDGMLRTVVDAICSTFAQFGGVMLAFAFIAAMGTQGLVTLFVRDAFAVNIYENGIWLYRVEGLILPYLFFQIPLMVITFLPAMAGLRREWSEAVAMLGGTRGTFWRRVGIPVLTPSFLGGVLLLFANSFSSYATAAALISQGALIVPLQIRGALVSETVLGRENLAGALALGMVVVMALLMWAYAALQRRTERWQR